MRTRLGGKRTALWVIGVVLVAVAIALIRGPLPAAVAASDYGEAWPFTVPEVTLHCTVYVPGGNRVRVEAEGVFYVWSEIDLMLLSVRHPVEMIDRILDGSLEHNRTRLIPFIKRAERFCAPAQSDVFTDQSPYWRGLLSDIMWRASLWFY